jgi:hypothetical protein
VRRGGLLLRLAPRDLGFGPLAKLRERGLDLAGGGFAA